MHLRTDSGRIADSCRCRPRRVDFRTILIRFIDIDMGKINVVDSRSDTIVFYNRSFFGIELQRTGCQKRSRQHNIGIFLFRFITEKVFFITDSDFSDIAEIGLRLRAHKIIAVLIFTVHKILNQQ